MLTKTRPLWVAAVLLVACSSAEKGTPETDKDPVGTPSDGDGDGPGSGVVGDDDPIKDPTGGDGDLPGLDAGPSGDGDAPGRTDAGDDGGAAPEDDSGTSSGDGDGPEPPDAGPVGCSEGSCCIDGKDYAPGTPNPANLCEVCEPDQSLSSFTPVGECGTGCTCSAGMPVETVCSDGADNDGDALANCADPDCAGKRCHVLSLETVRPSADLQRTQPGDVLSDGTATIAIQSTNALTAAVLKFDNIPHDRTVGVMSAVLHLYVDQAADLVLKTADQELGRARTSQAGELTFDITRAVQGWATGNGKPQYVSLNGSAIAGPPARIVTLHATEYDGDDTDPTLSLTYEAFCSAQACPTP